MISTTRLFLSTRPPLTPDQVAEIRAKRKLAKEKRKEAARLRKISIGKAKAVDRGQFQVTYRPAGEDGSSFRALSGLPNRKTPFTVLGIESSCDDTGAAVVRSDGVILGEALASQQEIHEEWGGVVPGLARDAHQEHIDAVVEEALQRAGMTSVAEVDAIGVTVGPGLELCLRVGCEKAKSLALEYDKPFVGVHHLEAHILMARLPSAVANNNQDELIHIPATDDTHASTRAMDFPFLALLVSGGHCQLMHCQAIGQHEILGGTMDDSLGEAFDKTARLLGLPVGGGGGPAVERLALDGNRTAVELPIPLRYKKSLDFSYSGLKTAVRKIAQELAEEHGVERTEDLPRQIKADIAASFQHKAIQHVEQRLKYAMDIMEQKGITTLAVVGGVAANKELRSRLEELCASRSTANKDHDDNTRRDWTMFVPPPRLCTDQGAMSAWAAVERIRMGSSDVAEGQEVYARYPFASLDYKTEDEESP